MAYILTINVTEGIFLYRKTKLLMAVVLIGASFLMGKTLSVHVSGNQIKKGKRHKFKYRKKSGKEVKKTKHYC